MVTADVFFWLIHSVSVQGPCCCFVVEFSTAVPSVIMLHCQVLLSGWGVHVFRMHLERSCWDPMMKSYIVDFKIDSEVNSVPQNSPVFTPTVMFIGFQCSESLGPTGGHLSGSKGNSVVPPQKIVISVVCCVKNLYWMLYHYNNRC